MKDVLIKSTDRQELEKWLLEIPAKFANPILQFLQQNEIKDEQAEESN